LTLPSAPRIRRNREYDPFADLYNRFWGNEYHSCATPVLDRLLLSRLKRGQTVLDVCCGTGTFAADLVSRGFDVTGIDASAQMLRHARRNAKGAKFITADVRDFNLNHRFHAAFSVFESLNHVPDADGLQQAFRAVRQHLRPRGAFLFDLVGPATYRRNWNTTHAIVEDDLVCGMRMNFEESTGIATCDVTIMETPPIWQRRDFTVRQTCHDRTTVQNALSEAGFGNPTLYSARDLGMPASLGSDRTFYLVTA
jgi:SAM-dependent methyltransferase